MVVWGGLRPIASRVIYDLLAVAGLSYATLARVHTPQDDGSKQQGSANSSTTRQTKMHNYNGWILVASAVLTLVSAGNFTNRWTLSFPMIPVIVLQVMRRISAVKETRALFYLIQGLSILSILLAIELSILFPAVELPPIKGPHHVGTIDVHIPAVVTTTGTGECDCSHLLPVRILYPTQDGPTWPKYLTPATAMEFCRESMRFGAPPPLKDFGWMLHTWRLTSTQTRKNAKLVPGDAKFPVVIFSHGLGGNADIYSYQTLSLAARGNIVVVMNHVDGSGPFVRTKSGKEVVFDYDTSKMESKKADTIRRNQTDIRVSEVLAATEAVIRMNQEQETWNECDDDDNKLLTNAGISFVGRMELDHITAMGHSFGGVTAITAAKRRPGLYKAVVAHEPAIGWLPDDARRSFFAKSKLNNLELEHTIKGLFEEVDPIYESVDDPTAHDVDTLLLFSHEWREKGYGRSHLIEEMYKHRRLGPQGGVAHFSYIDGAHHNEFSDTCMLTPLWLGRRVGITGKRNPLDTAQEIHERTVAFLNETRLRHGLPLPP